MKKIANFLKSGGNTTTKEQRPIRYYHNLISTALSFNKSTPEKKIENMYIKIRDAIFEARKNGINAGTGRGSLVNEAYAIKNMEFAKEKLYELL